MKSLTCPLKRLLGHKTCKHHHNEAKQMGEAAARHDALLAEQHQKLESLHDELSLELARHETPHNIH
jgi:hypothetical protein